MSAISIAPNPSRVRVTLGGIVLAESDAALRLVEGRSSPVLYIPRADVRWELFTRTATRTHCPHKGDASYYAVTVDGTLRPDVVWSYEDPKAEVAAIKDHLAFYPSRVDAIEEVARG
ncbi:hypothetical protein ASG40_09455 [Methylobacterium sp. Leaf399]|uniref:DUF427 domain-containing protein n=1 Tax=unclassified Methylobacterium TaxID=2615210 RepID=UPI0006F53559|nr:MULTISPECIES: DUF427 domain-containing protein [unclassified Methylobacterium]KQP55202.1 hypothetical protein ASF39_05695 [Methylobacterium sp. Leaf108]KQT09942.1 hypothetical protein ASG40_09455 [Methylobacterium sp. Leaf399]